MNARMLTARVTVPLVPFLGASSLKAATDALSVTIGKLTSLSLSWARREVGMICLLCWLIALLLTAPLAALAQEGRAQTAAGSGAVGAKAESESPGAGPRGSRGTSGVPEWEARIDAQVLALSTESLAESLAKLGQQEMYNWPGPVQENEVVVSTFPLPKDTGAEDLGHVFSNRRFLKVHEELALLDRSEAGALILERLRLARQVYEKVLSEFVAKPGFRNVDGPDTGPFHPGFGWSDSDNKDGSPTLRGTRFEVFALVLLAGVLRLETVHGEILDLAEYACGQRQSYSDPKVHYPTAGFFTLAYLSLYNRQILGTALLSTLPSAGLGDSALPPGVTWEEEHLTKYKAVYTTYDFATQLMGGGRPDFSQGTQTIRHLAALDDAAFNAIVARFR
jgi:hypothetical protein